MADDIEKKGLLDISMDDDDDEEQEVMQRNDFNFQDFHKESDLHTTGTIGDPGRPADTTTIPTHSLMDADDDDGDKTELLASERKAPPFWTFEYYQGFFDVDTIQVCKRIIGSMVPACKKNYLVTQIRPNPDLYGPFWVCATLVFTTAIAGNLASYLVEKGDHEWVYDFHKVTLAAGAIYTYAFLIPTALWGFLMWRRSVAGYSFLEILCVYGYSLSIYVPISILWAIPIDWLRWIFVFIGMALSGSVLVLTFWPAVEDGGKKIAILTMICIVVLHGLLAIGFKLYFFHGPPELHRMTTPAPSINATTTP